MTKRLFRPTIFGMAAALGVGLAAFAGAEEITSEARTHGWSVSQLPPSAASDQENEPRPADTVRLRRGSWRVAAKNVVFDRTQISLRGDVRIAGPDVYVIGSTATVVGSDVEVDSAIVIRGPLRLSAKHVTLSVDDSTLRLLEVGAEPGKASNDAPGAP